MGHFSLGAKSRTIKNKCVSILARRKSHHTALRDAGAPQFRLPRRAWLRSFFPVEICTGRCPNFSFFPGAMCIEACGGAPPRPKFTEMGEDMPRTNTRNHAKFHHCRPNGVREKSVTKNLLRQNKLNIPTILPYGGIAKQ